MTRTLPRLAAVLTAVLVTVLTAPAPTGADPASPTLTWAVQPADQQGPDGRRWVELTLDPGQVVTEHLAVRNFSDGAVVFSLKAADGYLTDKGRFNMLPSNQESRDGGTWLTVQDTVTVKARETKVVPFTITAPGDAAPGDHPAGIAATVTSAAGGAVAVESRVGFRVMLRASGTVTAALAADGVTAAYRRSWNPFSAGTLHVTYTTTNNGNVAVTGAGRVTVAGPFGMASHGAPTQVEETFRGGSRQVETTVAGVWPLGPLRTSVDVTPALISGDATGAEIRTASATMTAWALPWPQLALAAVVVALVLTVRTLVRRRRRRLARLIARAREEGRAERRESAHAGSPQEAP